MTTKLDERFHAAMEDGELSPASAQILAIPDLGAQIQAGLGITVDDVQASEVVLVTMMWRRLGVDPLRGQRAADPRRPQPRARLAREGEAQGRDPRAHAAPQRHRRLPLLSDRA